MVAASGAGATAVAAAEFSSRAKQSLAEQLKSDWIPPRELPEDQLEELGRGLEKAWLAEVKRVGRRQASLARAVYACFGRPFLVAAFWEIIAKCVFGVAVTIALGLLISDIQNYLHDRGFARLSQYSDKNNSNSTTTTTTASGDSNLFARPTTSPSVAPTIGSARDTFSWTWNSNETQIVVKSVALLVCLCGNVAAGQYYLFNSTYVGMKCRLACTYLIYRKALRINLLAMESKTSGQIMNLLTNDVNKFDSAFYYIQYVYIAPLQTLVIFTLLATFYMGLAPTLIGFLLVVVYLLAQVYLGTQFGRLRNESTARSDERVRAMNELVDSIGIIKMYAWEAHFERQVTRMRELELSVLSQVMRLRAINLSLFYGACKLLLMVIFVVYVLMGNKFNETKVFTALTMTNSMRTYLTLFFPYSVAQLNEMKVSLERIRQFLIQDELSQTARPPLPLTWPAATAQANASSRRSPNGIASKATTASGPGAAGKRADGGCAICAKFDNDHLLIDKKFAIIFHEVSVSWPKAAEPQHEQTQGGTPFAATSAACQDSAGCSHQQSSALGLAVPGADQAATSLASQAAPTQSNLSSANSTTIFNNLTAHIKHQEFVMIVGRVGTGKSSLLMTLLNELPIQSGSVRINGSLSYASQEPWLFAGTIRENITIAWHRQPGRDYKHLPTRLEQRYQRILRICCLDRDIQILPYGDLTQVGERGSALSGGQKARVNLARALFYEADIFLLDDPLAALDAAVAKHIFDECFRTFLKRKTVLLVTHQVQFSTPAQKVLLLHDSPDFSYGPAAKVLHNLLARYNLEPRGPASGAPAVGAPAARDASDEAKLVPVVVQNENPAAQLHQANRLDSLDCDPPMGEIETGSLIAAGADKTARAVANTGAAASAAAAAAAADEDEADEQLAGQYFRTLDSLAPAERGSAKARSAAILSPPSRFQLGQPGPGGQVSLKSGVTRSPSMRLLAEASLAADADKPADLATYLYYRRQALSVGLLAVFLAANVSTQLLFNGTDYFLSEWSSSESSRARRLLATASAEVDVATNGTATPLARPTNQTIVEYTFESDGLLRRLFSRGVRIDTMIGIYVAIIVVLLSASFARNMIFLSSCVRASRGIHRELVRGVLYAPMKFFDQNSIGTIMARFSSDLSILDDDISQTLIDVVEISTNVCGIILVTALVSYYNLVPALFVLLVANYFRRQSSQPITRLKQLETNKRGQVISQAMSTLHGLSTIRVFRLEAIINRRFERVQNEHTHIWYSYLSGLHRLTRLIDASCMVYFAALISMTMLLVFYGFVEASLVGLLVSQVIILPGPLQWGARQITELQSLMTSLVRIRDYCRMEDEQEALATSAAALKEAQKTLVRQASQAAGANPTVAPDSLPQPAMLALDELPDEWPARGAIKFEQITLGYATGADILHNVSFALEPGERVGIVGRTGAGKSSIIAALFRMTSYRGRVLIDDVDTGSLRLADLRRRISIISQEPILFKGSVRRNLDPFDEHRDETIWSALESVRLKSFVLELSGGLEGQVAEGGQNFSLGQRQLICLARVILRRNRILVLDEATANVDPDTDLFIQRTIRELFRGCTVLTIAHRLNTIMDSDRVLVLEAGQVREFDEPHVLLTRGGLLATMTANTGQQADRLRRLAERAYNRRHSQPAAQ